MPRLIKQQPIEEPEVTTEEPQALEDKRPQAPEQCHEESEASDTLLVRADKEGKERIAINLFDMERIDPKVRPNLFKDVLSPKPLRIGEGEHDIALELVCDNLKAAMIADMLRLGDREAGDIPTRIYIKGVKRSTWTKIPEEAVLANKLADNSYELNTTYFPSEIILAEPVPLQMSSIEF